MHWAEFDKRRTNKGQGHDPDPDARYAQWAGDADRGGHGQTKADQQNSDDEAQTRYRSFASAGTHAALMAREYCNQWQQGRDIEHEPDRARGPPGSAPRKRMQADATRKPRGKR